MGEKVEIKTDLDKLIYIMKLTEQKTIDQALQLPTFCDEDWIKTAMDVLDKSNRNSYYYNCSNSELACRKSTGSSKGQTIPY